jgi:hypothetical protein
VYKRQDWLSGALFSDTDASATSSQWINLGNQNSVLFRKLLTLNSDDTLSISGTNTSTFEGSINLPSGKCFAVDGVCLSSGGGGSGTVNSGTSGYLAYYPSTGTTVDDSGVYWSGSAMGIGDATPDYLLDVAGTLGIDGALTIGDASGDTVTSNAGAWTFANNTTVALNAAVNALNFDSNTLSIDATNNRIGVGTAAPSYPLHVLSTSDPQLLLQRSGAGSQASMRMRNGDSQEVGLGYGSGAFWIYDYTDSEYLLSADSSDEAGFWTSAPDRALEINSATGSNLRLTYNDNNGSAANYADFSMSSGGNLTIAPSGGTMALTGALTISGNTTIGDANTDTVTANAAAWSFPLDTTVAIGGGLNGLNFDANTLSIDALNDRIGIGTNAPDAKLQVMGTVSSDQVRIGTSADGYYFKMGRNSTTGHLQFEGSQGSTVSGFVFVNGASPFLITGTGNVGIGDSTPASLFTVGSGDLFQVNSSGAITAVTGITNSGNTTLGDASGDTLTFNASTVAIANNLNFDVNTLFIDAANNRIGISDTTPDDLLNISSASADAGLAISSMGTDTDPYIKFELTDGTPSFTMGVDDSDSDKFKISTTALGTSDRFVINSLGQIGVGTSAPDATMEINSASGGTIRLTYNDSNGGASTYASVLVGSEGNLYLGGSGRYVQTYDDLYIRADENGTVSSSITIASSNEFGSGADSLLFFDMYDDNAGVYKNWSAGVDVSDAFKFKINPAGLGEQNGLVVDRDGNCLLYTSDAADDM